jgi:hypothetical protein
MKKTHLLPKRKPDQIIAYRGYFIKIFQLEDYFVALLKSKSGREIEYSRNGIFTLSDYTEVVQAYEGAVMKWFLDGGKKIFNQK